MKRILFCLGLGFLGFSVHGQDGGIDRTFNPSGFRFDYSVSLLKTYDNQRLIAGGYFYSYNEHPAHKIVRIFNDGSIDTTFLSQGFGGNGALYVRSIAVQNDGKILVGGYFDKYGNKTTGRLIRLMPDGTLDSSFQKTKIFGGEVFSVLIQSDDKILVGGNFSGNYGGYLLRLLPDGTLDKAFKQSMCENVFSLALLNDGRILAGGDFSSRCGGLNHLARLNSDGTIDTTFNKTYVPGQSCPPWEGSDGTGADAAVFTIIVQDDDKIVLGGYFSSFGGYKRWRVARLNSNGSVDLTFAPKGYTNEKVLALSVQKDGKILVGGQFNKFSDLQKRSIVRLNTDGSVDETFNSNSFGFDNGFVSGFACHENGKILAVGNFTTYNGQTVNRIVRLNASESLLAVSEAQDTMSDVEISPNPFKESAVLKLPPFQRSASLKIFNTIGQCVRSVDHIQGESFKLERDNLPAGIYHYVLLTDGYFSHQGKLLLEPL